MKLLDASVAADGSSTAAWRLLDHIGLLLAGPSGLAGTDLPIVMAMGMVRVRGGMGQDGAAVMGRCWPVLGCVQCAVVCGCQGCQAG